MIALRICRAALLASALLPSLAWGGAGTITTKNAAGATITFTTVTDGSSNNLASGVLCDGVAGANCATVKAASTAAAQTDLALVMRNPDLVTGLADAACATDTGTCTIGQLIKRTNVDLATLNTSVNAGVATPGGAPPANIISWGALGSGATGGLSRAVINCDNHVFKHITTATDTLAVQGVASQTIFVCAAVAQAAGTATFFLENTASVNANCASANTQIGGVATMAANGSYGFYGPVWGGLKNTAGNGLCINSTGTGGFDLDIWYAQF